MATVTGYTAARMKQIEDASIVDGSVNTSGHLILTRHDGSSLDAGSVTGDTGPQGPPGSDPSIVICTSTTRPTGVDLFEGLVIYETNTNKMYVYDGTNWVFISVGGTEGSFGVKSATLHTLISTTGVDWNPTNPLDVIMTKKKSAAESYLILRLGWSNYMTSAGWGASVAGVKISGVSWFSTVAHQINIPNAHLEYTDVLYIPGIPNGTVTIRAVMKKAPGGNDLVMDIGDFFRIEYQEMFVN